MNTIHDARLALQGLGMIDGLSAEQVDERLGRYQRLDDIGRRGLAFYLWEVQERRLYQSFSYSSTVEYALHRHELSARRTRELLHAGAQLSELTLIDEAFCRQELSWSKVILLLRVASVEHEEAWLDKAKALGITELKREVRLAKRGGPPRDPDDVKGLPDVRFPVKASLGVVSHEMLETAQKKLTAERCKPATVEEVLELALGLYLDMERKGKAAGWNHVPSSHFRIHLESAGPDEDAPLLLRTDDGLYPVNGLETDGPVAAQRSACACCDGEHVSDDAEPVDAPTPAALRTRVLARDRHRCRCCGSRSQLHVHHIVLRSHGGRTKAYNLLTLCVRCHSLVHAGLLLIKGRTTKKARFLDREGRPIHRPDRSVDKGRLLNVDAPPRRPDVRGSAQGEPAPVLPDEERVTLATVPAVVDVAWLRRHVGLIRCGRDGSLHLRPGRPAPAPAPAPASPESPRSSAARASASPESPPSSAAPALSASAEPPPSAVAPTSPASSASSEAPASSASSASPGSSGSAEPPVSARGPEAPSRAPQQPGSTCRASIDEAFGDLVGRDDLQRRLRREHEGARALDEPFPHTLFTGPAGTGKTTLANGLARVAGGRLVRMNGPTVQDPATLLRLLASVEAGDMLFFDEVHAVPNAVLELLYQAMTESRLSLTLHERDAKGACNGTEEKAIELRLPAFTVLAATTLPAQLDPAFVSRFGVREHLAPLAEADLASLAIRAARGRGFDLTVEAGAVVAAHARGTPRRLLGLMGRVTRFAAARGVQLIDGTFVAEVLAGLGYDEDGLDPTEQRCVALLRASTDPISERRLAGMLGVDRETLTQDVEPWLLRNGWIRITRHGRVPGLRQGAAAGGQTPDFKPSAGRRKSAARLTLVGGSSS